MEVRGYKEAQIRDERLELPTRIRLIELYHIENSCAIRFQLLLSHKNNCVRHRYADLLHYCNCFIIYMHPILPSYIYLFKIK